MASSEYITEVEIHPDIQEVEIESCEIPCEDIETTIDCDDGMDEGQPMIALQPLPETGREEIILQEEIVGGVDPLSCYDQIPVPSESDIYIESSPGPSRRVNRKNKRAGKMRSSDHNNMNMMSDISETKSRKWEQKQVQIKTLEGEFSVTMWASGTDDGKQFVWIISFDV